MHTYLGNLFLTQFTSTQINSHTRLFIFFFFYFERIYLNFAVSVLGIDAYLVLLTIKYLTI